MVKLDNSEVNKILSVFNVRTGGKQNAVYFGVAEAIVSNLIHVIGHDVRNIQIPKWKLNIEHIIDQLGEIVIIDRDLLKHNINTVAKYKAIQHSTNEESLSRLKRVILFNSLFEYYGITDCYSQQDILDINSNFENYREAVAAVSEWLNSLSKD